MKHVWLVAPDVRVLEVYELTDDGWLLVGSLQEDDEVKMQPFDAAPFGLGVLWG